MTTGPCIYCGCTNDWACPGGCHWRSHEPPICSECDDLAGQMASAVAGLLGPGKVSVAFGYVLLDKVCRNPDRPRVQLDKWPMGIGTLAVPVQVAAYAAGLRFSAGDWERVAEVLKGLGLGTWPLHVVKGAADAWAKVNIPVQP